MRLLVVCWLGLLSSSTACASDPTPPPKAAAVEPAPVEPAKPERALPFDPAAIRPVVEAQYPAVNGCHAVQFSGADQSEGEIVVEWEITPGGRVKDPHVLSSTFESPEIERCVTEVTKSFEFPESGGSTDVSWKFKFRARGE